MRIFTLIICMAVFFALIGCDSGGVMESPIACLGDSLTEGYGAGGLGQIDRSRSYPAYLQRKVSLPVVNAGISGDTTSGALARLETDVLSKDPQIVIIFLGANDFFQQRPAEETKVNLQTIINRTRNGERKIFLVSFLGDLEWEANLINSPAGMIFTQHGVLLSEYRIMFNELVQENSDINFIPNIWTGVWGIHMSDPVHPSAEGYELIAETIFNAIRLHL